ncbi:MAG: amidohydrolase family protein [Actinomycetaceae bacterium]|nr:amidohydrolase family protein [Actinomycetaceae bacterium]
MTRLEGFALWASDSPVFGESSHILTGPVNASASVSQPHRWIYGEFEIRDGKIFLVSKGDPATAAGVGDRWIIPGLVDVHCHIGMAKTGAVEGEEMLAQAHADRDSGVLLVRDCGIPGDNSWISGRADGLTILRAGRHIAKPKRYIRGYALEIEDRDLPEAMAAQARVGDGWVKIVGDWIDRANGVDSDLDPLWSASALKEGVAAAHEAGARVTVHTFSRKAIDDLLEAGVDCIEHGTGMTPDHIVEAARLGIAVTPTLMQVALFPQFSKAAGAKYPVYASTMAKLWAAHEDTLQRFLDAGVQLLPGTDSGGYQSHGQMARELQMWTSMGLSASDILDLATWRAREFLGAPGLSDGADADLVVFDRDPREDIGVLATPTAVYYRGQQR